ncbi:MAG: hypothetical protein ACSHYF_18305 [Verrucomicrobiaceae bacterium]
MPEENPYQSPESNPAAPAPANPNLLPSAISSAPKVFGILHLIYAAIGLIVGIANAASSIIVRKIYETLHSLVRDQNEAIGTAHFEAALNKLIFISTIDGVFRIIMAILLFVTGIHLLQKKSSALKLNRIWAVTRIIAAVPLVILVGQAEQVLQTVMAGNIPPEGFSMGANSGLSSAFGIIILSVYPLISLIILSQQSVKNALPN